MTVPVITDAIVGAVAKAIAASATDRASKGSARWLKVRLGRTDEDRALRAALSSAFGSFRVSHRDWSQTFFDAHFLQHSAAPFLAQAVDPTTFPAAAELADAWERQFGAKQSPIRPDLLEACEAFLGSFRLAIRRSPAFQSLYDSEATDTILEEVRALKAAVDVAQMHREGTDRVARSIAAAYAGFDKVVTRLTDEQCRVIDLLRHYKRALVYGVAGSGKTLVAAEKAIRVARADRETLFICHNPNLAAWVRTLVQDSPVIVATVDEFVAGALGRPSPPLADWSPYSSPYNEDLDEAFDRISETGPYFDAVIVDEGQDFDETWWIVIEAAMRSDDAEFYVFYDESQALLPGRGRYPISGPPFDLSRNCRNAGRVYEMMRIIEPAAPEPDAALTGLGDAMCFAGTTDLASAIRAGVKWLLGAGALSDCVVLLGGGVPFEQSVLADLRFHPLPPLDWGDAIRRAFRQLQALISSHLAQQRALHPDRDPATLHDVGGLLEEIGRNRWPTEEDVRLVRRAADICSRHLRRVDTGVFVSWHMRRDGPLARLELSVPPRRSPQAVLQFFASSAWTKLPVIEPETIAFASHESAGSGNLPVYSVGEFKGLEHGPYWW